MRSITLILAATALLVGVIGFEFEVGMTALTASTARNGRVAVPGAALVVAKADLVRTVALHDGG